MRFIPGPILDPDAQKQRDEAIERSERRPCASARQQTANLRHGLPIGKRGGALRMMKLTDEVLSKMKKGKI